MLDKFKKPCCIEFYNAYDSILKNMGFHYLFIHYIKKKICNLESIENAHKALIDSFIDFTRARTFTYKLVPQNEVEIRRDIYIKVFDFCYKKTFNGSSSPSDPKELKASIFKSKTKCLKIFDEVRQCRTEPEISAHKEKVLYIVEEFWFVRTLSVFIKKHQSEGIDFFKRFFSVYPFEKPSIPSEDNSEWEENHKPKFDIIKNYKKASTEDFQSSRQWFKEQLEKVKFADLSEQQKSTFFIEMLVAFGNISAEKTGDSKGYWVPLKNAFYLGRYFNIHALPLDYVEKKRATLENIARETWRRICKFKITPKEQIDEALRKGLTKISQSDEKEIYGNNAPRISVERLSKQLPYGGSLDKNDDFETAMFKILSKMDLPKLTKVKSQEEFMDFYKGMLETTGIDKVINNGEKEDAKNLLLNQGTGAINALIELSPMLAPFFPIYKPGTGLLTHYDFYEAKKSLKELPLENILKGF